MFENCTDGLFNDKIILKSQQIYTQKKFKIALSSDDDERLQTFDGIETYTEQIHLKCAKMK